MAKSALARFWKKYPESKDLMETWFAVTKAAKWTNPTDVKQTYPSADQLQNGRMIFDIGGNKYRLIGYINYEYQIIYIRFVGTHKEYDRLIKQDKVDTV